MQKIKLGAIWKRQIAAGSGLYGQHCAVCHGDAGQGGGVLPDLRYSAPRVFDGYADILLEGRLLDVGMPSLAQFLSEDDVEALHAFVLSERAKLVEGR